MQHGKQRQVRENEYDVAQQKTLEEHYTRLLFTYEQSKERQGRKEERIYATGDVT